MLKLILCPDWTVGRDHILNQIAADVSAELGNRYLIVPELISHEAERRLAMVAGDTCSRYAEVLSFKRLIDRYSDYEQCVVPACMDNGGRIVAMAAAVKMLTGKLKTYASVSTKPEFLTGLVEAVDEFKRCCISPDDLRRASERSEGEFAQKLEELSLVCEAYNAITSRGKCDPRDQMTWLLEQMETSDFARSHVVYVDGFPDFTRQHMEILAHFIQNSPNVTVSLNCDSLRSKQMAFEKVSHTAQELVKIAVGLQIPYEVIVLNGRKDVYFDACNRLFQGSSDFMPGLSAFLKLNRGESVYEECIGAVERILNIVHNGGRYRDVGLVCADLAAYENALKLAFTRSGIPYYRSGTDVSLQKTVISALICAVNVAVGGFDKNEMFRYMRSILCSLEPETCDLLENYCFTWNVSGQAWCNPWTKHPHGLAKDFDAESYALLNRLEEARFVLVQPLLNLQKGLKSATNLAEQTESLYKYFLDISLADRLSELAEHMDASGDNRTAQILNQLWDILVFALEQLHDVLGDTAWDAESFIRLFTLLLSQYDIGSIPTVLDAVCMGEPRAMRCTEVKHLIILGAKEGALPSYSKSSGVLTDREREQLRSLDIPLTGGGLEGVQTEFYEIFACFAGAKESTELFCGAEQPSFVYNRLVSMVGKDHKLDVSKASVTTDPMDAAAWLVAQGDTDNASFLGIGEEYLKMKACANYDLGDVSDEGIRGLYGKELNFSASQVDRQAKCRCSYFLSYGLKLQERKEATVDPAQFGTYFHEVMEKTAKEVMKLGGFRVVSLEKTMELAVKYSKEYIDKRFADLDSERVAYLFERNIAELELLTQDLWEELSIGLFDPIHFELKFGKGKTLPPVDIPGAGMKASLDGAVDRVDIWKDRNSHYFRIVDYKTGQKSFDYCDVFNGIGLQMLLYLFALEEQGENLFGENPIPAGVQYFSAQYPYLPYPSGVVGDADRKKLRSHLVRKGLVLNDDRVLDAMQPDGANPRLDARRNKEGQWVGDLFTVAQLKQLKKYVFIILRRLVNEIESGNVRPNPYSHGDDHSVCNSCRYSAICRRDESTECRNYTKTPASRFWEDVEREVSEHG